MKEKQRDSTGNKLHALYAANASTSPRIIIYGLQSTNMKFDFGIVESGIVTIKFSDLVSYSLWSTSTALGNISFEITLLLSVFPLSKSS